ncbi:tripartite motif-containing protein 2-like [Littorina saxatilis]|uniref:tripartite motif-containing protein 2-like n=1 Tax=Littorina saxatilis TaxID=31220 RepID=UPI0038B5E553
MNISLTWKSRKTADKDENANPALTSDLTRHKHVMTLDYMSSKERQSRNTEQSKKIPKSDTTSPRQYKPGMAGHVNVLFCCDDDSDDLPTLRVECGRQIGGRGSGQGQLQDATDLKFARDGSLFVTDLVNSRVQKFDENGDVVSVFQSEDILEPWASAVTPDGHVAITSRKNSKVIVLDIEGNVTGSFGENHLSCPSGIAVTGEGNFIVTDFQTSKVFVFSADGSYVRQMIVSAGSTFNQPRYVTVSPHGDVIVSDSGNHRLVVFDKNFNFVRAIGSFGKRDGFFKFPHATCTDDLGNILVCDRYNDRVSAFTRKGEFVRHLVTSVHKLHHPQGLALSPNTALYVSHGGLKAHTVTVVKLNVSVSE